VSGAAMRRTVNSLPEAFFLHIVNCNSSEGCGFVGRWSIVIQETCAGWKDEWYWASLWPMVLSRSSR